MRLDELTIKSADRYTPRDTTHELAWVDFKTLLKKPSTKVVTTNNPNIRLLVARRFGRNISVYILAKQRPTDPYDAEHAVRIPHHGYAVGFANLIRPTPLKNGPAFSDSVYTPHSGLMQHVIGQGYMKAVYRWVLEAGNHLVTGDIQTPASNALWKSLASEFEVQFIDDQGKAIDNPSPERAQQKDVRILLKGTGNAPVFK